MDPASTEVPNSFAVPSVTAAFVLAEVRREGRVRRARLGIAGEDVLVPAVLARSQGLAEARGVAVRGVESTGPGARAGLVRGDVIVRFAGHPVTGVADLHRWLDGDAIGRPLPLVVLRAGRRLDLEVKAEEMLPAAA